MLSALAEPPWCVCSAGLGTPEVFPLGVHVAGCPSWVPLLADPLCVAGRTGSAPLPPLDLVVVSASGGGGGAPSSGPSGFRRWEPSPFRTLSGGCLFLHWQAWRDRGAEPWVVEVLRVGYCLPFLSTPPLSNVPIPMPSSSPTSIKGAALEEVTLGLIAKGAVELAPLTSPGFYSRLFVVWKTSGSWRPVIDLSHLIRFVGRVFLPNGNHSVCAPVGASGGTGWPPSI